MKNRTSETDKHKRRLSDEDLEYELKKCLNWMARIEPIWAREFKAWLPNYIETLRLERLIDNEKDNLK